MTSAITVDDVSKTFKIYRDRNQSLKATLLSGRRAKIEEFTALKNVSLEIPEGKTFGLMGNNGSGKSTLLKCIAKILTPNSGSITSTGKMAAMLEVGSGFHPELSGRENVYLNGTILGMSEKEIDSKFDEIVDFSGIEEFIDEPVKNYSSGMYVRLGFSVSIHVDPDILLVDEVLAVGDMNFQEKCMSKFADLKEAGKTVVVVSHSLGQMRTFCDDAAWLDHGELRAVGAAPDIIDSFADETHQAKPVDGGGTRSGSGEIQVSKVEIVSAAGEPVAVTRTGDARRLRIHYESFATIEQPIFGINIDTENQWVWSITGRDGGFIPQRIEPGAGFFDIEIPWVSLRPGTYYVSTSIHGDGGRPEYDIFRRAAAIAISSSPYQESGGVVSMNSRFVGFQPPLEVVKP